MIAKRATPTDNINCPASGCNQTFMDRRRFTEHIKHIHTLPVSVSNVTSVSSYVSDSDTGELQF